MYVVAGEPGLNSAYREALLEVGSTSLDEFLIHFNVDILSPLVQHADDEVGEREREREREGGRRRGEREGGEREREGGERERGGGGV